MILLKDIDLFLRTQLFMKSALEGSQFFSFAQIIFLHWYSTPYNLKSMNIAELCEIREESGNVAQHSLVTRAAQPQSLPFRLIKQNLSLSRDENHITLSTSLNIRL